MLNVKAYCVATVVKMVVSVDRYIHQGDRLGSSEIAHPSAASGSLTKVQKHREK